VTYSTPVAFFVFNRPEVTQRVFAEIAKIRPSTLLLVADGPRTDRVGEAELCAAVREIVESVDWECDVRRNYADQNLGCRVRVSSGLDWVFSEVEEAVILEDDCLPAPDFFRFCAALLARYRDDERVMMITGDNFQPGTRRPSYSYYFSAYAHVWGWASWRRAWSLYDVSMSCWPAVRDELFRDLGDGDSEKYWKGMLDRTLSGEIDTWDFQWMLACWMNHGLIATPEANLISNIGFGGDATHTSVANHLADLPYGAMHFPLEHPPYMVRDLRADEFTFSHVFQPRAARPLGSPRQGIRAKLRSALGV
jgi:hypothetical protein